MQWSPITYQVLGDWQERLPAGGAREGSGEEGGERAHAQLGEEGIQEVHHAQDRGAQGMVGRITMLVNQIMIPFQKIRFMIRILTLIRPFHTKGEEG